MSQFDAHLVREDGRLATPTALAWAVATCQPVLVELLLEWGADKRIAFDGHTPLSISRPHSRVRELLEQSETLRARFLARLAQRRRALRRWRVCRWALRLSTYQAYLQRRFAPKTLKTDESGRSYMTCDAIDEMVKDCGSFGLVADAADEEDGEPTKDALRAESDGPGEKAAACAARVVAKRSFMMIGEK